MTAYYFKLLPKEENLKIVCNIIHEMLFKQLFENESSTYTYLISCPDKKEAVLIDPVIEPIERDLHILK